MREPAWCRGASRQDAYIRGIAAAPSVPVFVVLVTFVGFGALAQGVGLTIAQAVFISVSVFALPGQVVLVDQIAQGAALVSTAFAVTLTSVRLLPLTISLMPYLRDGITPRWMEFLFAHVLAITIWIESMRRLPQLPVGLRAPYYGGFVSALFVGILCATTLGFLLSAQVPQEIGAGLIFLTPIYFFLSLISVAANRIDLLAVAIGAVLGPILFLMAPGLDLFLTGLIGGTIAFAIGKWRGAHG
jgi:predicted branched-subunit amino acid permease